MASSANYRHRLRRYAVLKIGSPNKQQTMKAQTEHFRVSSNAQDRIKLPRVFWAGLKSIGLTPGAVLPKQPATHGLQRGEPRNHGSKLLDLAGNSRAVQRPHDRLEIHEPGRNRPVSPDPPRRPARPNLSRNPSRDWRATNSFAVPRNFGSPKKAMRFLSRSPGPLPGRSRRLRY